MTALVIAEHDNASIKAATLNAVTAAKACGGDVHVLVAGEGAGAAAAAAAQIAGVALPTILVMEVLGAALATVAIYRSGESSRPWKPLSRSNTAGDERES